jgi:hypothetical protein
VNEDTDSNNETTQAKNESPVIPVDISKVDAKENTESASANEKNGKRKPLSCFEIWTIVLASVGILVAAFTGVAIYWQARISARTLTEIQKGGTDTHDLAAATRELAIAANAQAGATRMIAENSQLTTQIATTNNRPFIVVKDIGTQIDGLGGFRFNATVINASLIGATNVSGKCEMFLSNKRFPETDHGQRTPIIIGAGQVFGVCTGAVPASIVNQLKSAVDTLSIFVHLTYDGPTGHYKYCTKQQYVPDENAFGDFGSCDASKPFPQ